MPRIESLLITGGAGFVGSNLAFLFRERLPELAVTAFDNLHRRGSELNLPRLRDAGVEFVHGDVRNAEDFTRLPAFQLLIDDHEINPRTREPTPIICELIVGNAMWQHFVLSWFKNPSRLRRMFLGKTAGMRWPEPAPK